MLQACLQGIFKTKPFIQDIKFYQNSPKRCCHTLIFQLLISYNRCFSNRRLVMTIFSSFHCDRSYFAIKLWKKLDEVSAVFFEELIPNETCKNDDFKSFLEIVIKGVGNFQKRLRRSRTSNKSF